MIKAITFDLWGTLIKSNPRYKEERVKVIKLFYPEYNLTDEIINESFSYVKKSYDENVEKFGISYDSKYLYEVVLNKIGLQTSIFKIMDIMVNCNTKFVQYTPSLYNDNIKNNLELLSKKYELHLISNTLLIDGVVLREVLNKLDVLQYFKSTTFSNEVGISKPNHLIFKKAHENILYTKEEILHIGDNMITDYNGSRDYGFNSVLVNNHELTQIDKVLEKLINE